MKQNTTEFCFKQVAGDFLQLYLVTNTSAKPTCNGILLQNTLIVTKCKSILLQTDWARLLAMDFSHYINYDYCFRERFRNSVTNLYFCKKILVILGEKDWVLLIILFCILTYLVMLQGLQRKASIYDFIMQKKEDVLNEFPSWLLITLVNILLLSSLVSSYIPLVPRWVAEVDVLGYGLNEFGYAFGVILGFYFIRCVLTFLYYILVGDGQVYPSMFFWASKFYFIWSFILIILVFTNYYIPIDKALFFKIFLIFIPLSFLAKIIFYLFHRETILPTKWYYKFLYICTLQISPLLALWRMLFF